jgi:hypothetical protein
MFRLPRYFLLGSQTTLQVPLSQSSIWEWRHCFALRTGLKVGTDSFNSVQGPYSVQNPLESMLLHGQL